MQRSIVGLCVLGFAALAPAAANAQSTVKVGVILPYSGQFADVAAQVDNGIKLYIKQNGDMVAGKKIEVVRKDGDQLVARFVGEMIEDMRRVAVDLGPHQDKEIYIRLVDRNSGGWGHINFDDFRFHAAKPNVSGQVPLDAYQHAGLPPAQAAEVMTLPPGFKATLFAGEPDVHQPIAMTFDDRGRLWVAEAFTYPRREPGDEGKDDIVVFEDADGDGRFEKRTVFLEHLNLVSGLEVGFGEDRPLELTPEQADAAHQRFRQVGAGKIGSASIGFEQHRLGELGIAQIGLDQVGLVEVGLGEVGAGEVCPAQHGTMEARAAQIGAGQVGATGVESGPRGDRQPSQPGAGHSRVRVTRMAGKSTARMSWRICSSPSMASA